MSPPQRTIRVSSSLRIADDDRVAGEAAGLGFLDCYQVRNVLDERPLGIVVERRRVINGDTGSKWTKTSIEMIVVRVDQLQGDHPTTDRRITAVR